MSGEVTPVQHETDRAIALTLNGLVDDGDLETKTLNNATLEMIDEFVRIHWERILAQYSVNPHWRPFRSDERDKIRRRMGQGESVESRAQLEKVEEILAEIVRAHKKDGVVGFILFGSRIDPDKIETDHSDLDLVCVLDSRFNYVNRGTVLSSWLNEAIDQMGDLGVPNIQLKEYYMATIKEELDMIVNQTDLDTGTSVPIWAWKSQGFRFVGENAEVINTQLQQAISSKAFQRRKLRYLRIYCSLSI